MSRVKSKDTTPELAVRRLVFGMGYRYRLHCEDLPGKPDLVFVSRGKAIFVNGCFWHGHRHCRYAKLPKTRMEFWQAKIETNKKRDRCCIAALAAAGWKVLTIWQCETKHPELLAKILYDFIENK